MVTTALGRALWDRFKSAPFNWLNSAEGQNLIEKSLAHLRKAEGEAEALALENLISAVVCLPEDA